VHVNQGATHTVHAQVQHLQKPQACDGMYTGDPTAAVLAQSACQWQYWRQQKAAIDAAANCVRACVEAHLQHHTAPGVSMTRRAKRLKLAVSSAPSNPPKLPGAKPRMCMIRACQPCASRRSS